MRPLLTLLACALLGGAASACGGSSQSSITRSTSDAAAAHTSAKPGVSTPPRKDRDEDLDNNDDDYYVLGFGHAAGAADNRAIATMLRRYFAAAAAEDGAKACSLLTPFVAEAIVEQNRHTPLEGKTCTIVMSKLFKVNHRELLGKSANLKVMRIGVEGNRSRVALQFPEIPVIRQITMRRQDNRWTVLDQLDHLIE
jgi:hypothetical protein